MFLVVPIDTLGETSYAQAGDAEGAAFWGVFLVVDKPNLGSYKLHTE